MEKIYTIAALTPFARRYWLATSFVFVAALLLVGLRFNAESAAYGVYHGDEYHTVHQGLNLLVDGHVDNFRAQEGTRWLVRAFYPGALIYMNTHMGGNVYLDGWSYPGHDYVVQNFVHQKDDPAAFSLDPNLRDLFHALRLQYILFVFICLICLFWFYFKKGYRIVAFGGIVMLGMSLELQAQQTQTYIEPAILGSLALLLLAFSYCIFTERISKHAAILFGFLSAFLLSVKVSAVPFTLLPPLLFAYLLSRKDALRQSLVYAGAVFLLYVVINFPAFLDLQSFNLFLHDLSSNFWHYAAGSDSSVTVAPGMEHLGLIVYQFEELMGYLLYAFPILAIFGFVYANKKERIILVSLLTLTTLTLWSLATQHVYLPRNAVPFYLPAILVLLLNIEILARHYATTRKPRFTKVFLAGMACLWLVGIVLHGGGPSAFAKMLVPNQKTALVGQLQVLAPQPADAWYEVGFPENFFKDTGVSHTITQKSEVPSVLTNGNYQDLFDEFSSAATSTVVIVNNVGNNKHLTHRVLPTYFTHNVQFGSYYVFFNAK